MVRRGGTHARTDAAYLGWNLLVAAPMGWLAWSHLHAALTTTIVAYVGAAVAWLYLKRRLLRRHPIKAPHVTA
jgi:hypothetical protein